MEDNKLKEQIESILLNDIQVTHSYELIVDNAASKLLELFEDVAVKFAEWVDKNHYGNDGDFMWYQDVNQIKQYSTKELFDYFINNIYQKQ